MSNKFIGIGPEFGNECCICEGIGDNLTGVESIAPFNDKFSPLGSVYTGCIDTSGDCLVAGAQVVADCTGDLRYFTIVDIEENTSFTPPKFCLDLDPVDDPLPPNERGALSGCSWQVLCIDDSCQSTCTQAIPLYGGAGGPCFPYTCCPCPETGSYSATASFAQELILLRLVVFHVIQTPMVVLALTADYLCLMKSSVNCRELYVLLLEDAQGLI